MLRWLARAGRPASIRNLELPPYVDSAPTDPGPFWRVLGPLLAVTTADGAEAEPLHVVGRVVGMSDCDTIIVLDGEMKQHNVRLAGIDEPKLGPPFGNASKDCLSRLVFNKRVEARCYKKDRYRSKVCGVIIGTRDAGADHAGA
jgi:endonuclease YncB( thermonuclease family)